MLSRRLLVGHNAAHADRASRLALRGLSLLAVLDRRRKKLTQMGTPQAFQVPLLPALHHPTAYGDSRSVQHRARSGFADAVRLGPSDDVLPYITISVVTFDSARWVASWFKSLQNSDYPLNRIHLVIRDHSPTETTLDAVWDAIPSDAPLASLRAYSAKNIGFGGGHAEILAAAGTRLVLVSNVDLEYAPDAISRAVAEAWRDDPRTACWEFRQTPFEHPKYYDPYTSETWWCSHACILLDRDKVLGVGSYDRKIFMYGEDVDLSLRLRAEGYRLRYLPRSVVAHHTYDAEIKTKPLQVYGSLLASAFIKLKFGSLREVVNHAAKIALLKTNADQTIASAATASAALLTAQGWRWAAHRMRFPRLPFFDFDYELVRDGAFFRVDHGDGTKKDDAPLVSIIVRTHGARLDLARGAVASILRQTYRPIEILLCEDGGAHIGEAIAEDFGAPDGVRFVHIPCEAGGRSKTANAGLRSASGDYIGFLDDDDALFADHVEILVEAIRARPPARAAYAKAFEVEARRFEDELYDVAFKTPACYDIPYSPERLLQTNLFPIQAVLFRRSILSEAGYIDENVDMLEDWNFWCKVSIFTDFIHVNKTTSLYRVPHAAADKVARIQALDAAYNDVRRLNLEFCRRSEADIMPPLVETKVMAGE